MKKAWTVFLKEIKDAFRDKRTLITSILIPALIFPILMTFMNSSISNTEKEATENIKIVYLGEESQLKTYLTSLPNLTLVQSQDPLADLEDSKISAIIEVAPGFDQAIKSGLKGQVSIKYDESKIKSSIAASALREYINAFSTQIAQQRLEEKGIDPSFIQPLDVTSVNVAKAKGEGTLVLSILLPMFLLIYPAAGAMATAIDQGAGEKERGTLEPLLSTKASRTSIAIGKWLSTSLASLIGTMAFMSGFAAAIAYNPGMFGEGFSISPSALSAITILGILMAFIYSASMLALSVFARNIKEASTYLSPFVIVAMLPAYGSIYTDVKTAPFWQYNVPLLNVTLVIKEALLDSINWGHFALTAGWLIVLVFIFLSLVVRMFNSESVVFRS
ncbi:MAG: ABC transporter permease [Clostridia bacterium]|nr:ABC transporter permease [Clostridia bacterium]